MLIPSRDINPNIEATSLSRRVNANSQRFVVLEREHAKLIKKGEC